MKTSEELMISHPALALELQMITTEIRAGKPRIEAFKNFALRTHVDDVRALVAMLVQTDRFGTSVAQALRTHAATSRTKRRQRAEEKAAKIGVKLVFPLVFFLFPAFYVVTLGSGGHPVHSGLLQDRVLTQRSLVNLEGDRCPDALSIRSVSDWRRYCSSLYLMRRRARLRSDD